MEISPMFNLCWVNQNTLACDRGDSIGFVDVTTGPLRYDFTLDKESNGVHILGISCISGNKADSIYAVGDISTPPRIVLFSYPASNCICELKNPSILGFYRQLKFWGSDILVALAFCENYFLEVWNWRDSMLLLSKETNYLHDQQHINCSLRQVMSVVQTARNTPFINVWDMKLSIDVKTAHKTPIQLKTDRGFIGDFSAAFDADGSLFLAHANGIVWHIIHSLNEVTKIIALENHSQKSHIPLVVFKSGIVLADSEARLKHFRKIESEWSVIWCVDVNYLPSLLLNLDSNTVLVASADGIIEKLCDEKSSTTLSTVSKLNCVMEKCALIYPHGRHLALQSNLQEIIIIEIDSGQAIERKRIAGIVCIDSHRTVPILGVGTSSGIVIIFEFNEQSLLLPISQLHVTPTKVQDIKFVPYSDELFKVDEEYDLFCIQRKTNQNEDIKKFISLEPEYIDLSTTKVADIVYTMILYSEKSIKKEAILSFCLLISIEMNAEFSHSIIRTQLKHAYSSLQFSGNDSNKSVLGSRTLSSEIDLLIMNFTKNGDMDFVIQRSITTTHTIGLTKLFVDGSNMLTFGSDGKVLLWDTSTMRIVKSVVAHDKCSRGVKQAVLDPFQRSLVSLGWTGNVICFTSSSVSFDFLWINAPHLGSSAEHKQSFDMDNIMSTEPWKCIEKRRITHEEELFYESITLSIMQDLKSIRQTIEHSMEINDREAHDESFPLQFFNLDVSGAYQQCDEMRQHLEPVRNSLEEQFSAEKLRIDNVKKLMWNHFEYKPLKLYGVFKESLFVENFPMTHIDNKLANVEFLKKIVETESLLDFIEACQPWIWKNTLTQTEIEWPEIGSDESTTDETNVLDSDFNCSAILNESQQGISVDDEDLASYKVDIFHIVEKLKKRFNVMFTQMKKMKEREMEMIKRCDARLAKIHADVELLDQLESFDISRSDLDSFDYASDENISELLTLTKCGSDSSEDMNTSKQKLSSDAQYGIDHSFYGEALSEMMDGFVQAGWEDELEQALSKLSALRLDGDKNEVARAKQRQFIKNNAKLAELRANKEKYVIKLLDEKRELETTKKVRVEQMNQKFMTMIKAKVQVLYAITAELMQILVNVSDRLKFRRSSEMEQRLFSAREALKVELNTLIKTQQILDQKLLSAKSSLEEVIAKDQSIDKQFKTFCSDFSPVTVSDQAYRIFKRRPKSLSSCKSSTVLSSLAKHITANHHKTATILPDECNQYLQNLEMADKFSNAPSNMDQSTWSHLCKMRRMKIETEFKLQSLNIVIAGIEAETVMHNKILALKKASVATTECTLNEYKERKENYLRDRKALLSFKLGNIQIKLTGDLENFDSVMMLNKTELARTNLIIEEAALKKLKITRVADSYRSQVAHYEWKYSMLQMKKDDLNILLTRVEKCMITKEVKLWLNIETEKRRKPQREQFGSKNCGRAQGTKAAILKQIENVNAVIVRERKRNMLLDSQIASIKVEIDDKQFSKDYLIGEKDLIMRNERMAKVLCRSQLLRKIRKQHMKLLELSAMLELQQLRTYPTLNTQSHHPHF